MWHYALRIIAEAVDFANYQWYNRGMEGLCRSFSYVAAPACRVLVLGSMPGVASLAAGQYYAHARNAFWPIVYGLWGETPSPRYEDRLAFALAHGIALWDVAQSCVRPGSSDSAIRAAVPNDFAALFAAYPGIHTVLHNGRQSQLLFGRLAADTAQGKARILLPSTSPAYTLPFDQKLAAWRVLRTAVEQEIQR